MSFISEDYADKMSMTFITRSQLQYIEGFILVVNGLDILMVLIHQIRLKTDEESNTLFYLKSGFWLIQLSDFIAYCSYFRVVRFSRSLRACII